MILPICRFHRQENQRERACGRRKPPSFGLLLLVFLFFFLFWPFLYKLEAIISGSFSTSEVLVGSTLTIKEGVQPQMG